MASLRSMSSLISPIRSAARALAGPSFQSTLRMFSTSVVAAPRSSLFAHRAAFPNLNARAFCSAVVPPSERKLYVGNLSFKVLSEDLESHFSQFGRIEEAFVVMDRENPGRSRGFGFVVFESKDDATTAVEKTNESEWMGRFLKVNFSIERARDGGGGGGYRGGGAGGYGGGGYGGGGGGGGYRSGGGGYGGPRGGRRDGYGDDMGGRGGGDRF